MIVSFSIPGSPCSKNELYLRLRRDIVGRNGRRRGLILTKKARLFRERVFAYASSAFSNSDWPRDPLIPKSVRLTIQAYGTRHDAGAATPIIKDIFQGLYYYDDRIVCQGPEEPSIRDGSEPRVDVTLELLEVRTQAEAVALRDAQRKRRERALAKKLGIVQQSAKKVRSV